MQHFNLLTWEKFAGLLFQTEMDPFGFVQDFVTSANGIISIFLKSTKNRFFSFNSWVIER